MGQESLGRQAAMPQSSDRKPESCQEESAWVNGSATVEITKPSGPAPDGEWFLDFLQPSAFPGSRGALGRYEILESIGRGAMGVVLKGFDTVLRRLVAI